MRCIPLFLSLFCFYSMALGQKVPPAAAPPPPPPMAKATPSDPAPKTDEQIRAETLELIKKPVEWKERPLRGFNIKVFIPRDTIYNVENIVEPGFGNVKVYSHVTLGEAAVYTIGKLSLPYVVTDEGILRNLYKEFVNGMAEEEGTAFQHISDFLFEGQLGVEFRSLPSDAQYQSARARAFVYGRDVYFLYAMPTENEYEDDPPDSETFKSRTAEFNNFFDSVRSLPLAARPPVRELPIFASSFTDGIFTSDYFKFSFEPPKGWIMLTQEDVNDLRVWSRKTINDQTGLDLKTNSRRTNMFSIMSAPLGSENTAMIALNLGFPSNSFNDVKRLSRETQKLVSTLENYKQIKAPHDSTIGNLNVILTVNEIDIAGVKQQQYIYFFMTRGYVMNLSINCHIQADCTKAVESLSTWKNDSSK